MIKGVFIAGTDTEVGKTFVTAGIAAGLMKKGFSVGIMKPVASGAVNKNGKLISEDADFYHRIFNLDDDYNLINPYCFKAVLAPGVAARLEGVSVRFDDIKEKYYKLLAQYDILLVEGAGGLLSPLSEKLATNADLAQELGLPIIIVSRSAIGTINHTLLSLAYAQDVKRLQVLGVIINQENDRKSTIAEKTNCEIIKEMSGADLLGVIPYCKFVKDINMESLNNFFIDRIDWSIFGYTS